MPTPPTHEPLAKRRYASFDARTDDESLLRSSFRTIDEKASSAWWCRAAVASGSKWRAFCSSNVVCGTEANEARCLSVFASTSGLLTSRGKGMWPAGAREEEFVRAEAVAKKRKERG